MEFNEKLQQLRKQRGLTQEELAEALYVSRTAVSKWESGRGYPSIDSLKTISGFFSVSLDELLSSDTVLNLAEQENRQKELHTRGLVFGLLGCCAALFLFLPFFGQPEGDGFRSVPLLALTDIEPYIKTAYLALVFALVLWGVLLLGLQNCRASLWLRCREKVSLGLDAAALLLFMASRQPYAAAFSFLLAAIKALMLIKWD